ncbi:MAG: glutamate--tRNA ligase [Candidatus Buchananbacteria bacterium RBG_13_39_9]|uniref:Glutamate--tRNA ligase n=1 Tax=Candidatus Buchananbacteria bacterium RBG_13_39_9 TaxID=1797531 RepID=A0A1G1XNL4_9BACT|nr:MAG: glutamate--tRNA ligase [Candidatus Buchananbacteria bacterium RBG_13_39_9]
MKRNKGQKIYTRFPPSPTGTLHIGGARTALFNFLFARHYGGKFFLRIEDTDTERSKPEFEKDIIENLKWLGLEWDGEILKQSQRKNVYKKYIKKLLKTGDAFWCYHTKEELEKEKQEKASRGEPQVHFCEEFRGGTTAAAGVIRLKCTDEQIKFHDLIRGEIEFNPSQIGDIVIAKDEESPLYNFAVVIDDYETKITHVIRGEDHISNTPKQIMILEALELPLPQYAHIPLTLAPDKTKLSKRHGATAISEYKEMGYLPKALVNFMALLGWNPGDDREIFPLDELIKEFAIERMQKSAAIFNIEKLDWFNSYYIRQTPIEKLTQLCLPHLLESSLRTNEMSEAIPSKSTGLLRRLPPPRNDKFEIIATGEIVDIEWLQKVVKLEQKRMKKLSEIGELTKFFFTDTLEYDADLLKWKNMSGEEAKLSLDKSYNILSKIKDKDFTEDKLKAILMPEADEMGDRGRLLWPLRASITGLKASPGPFEVLAVLGREKALKRIKRALEKINEKTAASII